MKTTWREDFNKGFDIGPMGAKCTWTHPVMGSIVPDDGVVSIDQAGVKITSSGRNTATHQPAFRHTVPQNHLAGGLSGQLDHVKWLSLVNRVTPSGILGFAVPAGQRITVETVIGGQTFGTEMHPFGRVVSADADPRLASAGLVCTDVQSGVVLDFFLTNRTVYAVYERLAHGRHSLGNYAAFLYCVPVGIRQLDQLHLAQITYDTTSGMAEWILDGSVVLLLPEVGKHIDRQYMLVDNGGEEQVVPIHQLACGLGMFTILDGAVGNGRGLVDLSGVGDYFDTRLGEPVPATFTDEESLQSNRLFGQGAELICHYLSVSTA